MRWKRRAGWRSASHTRVAPRRRPAPGASARRICERLAVIEAHAADSRSNETARLRWSNSLPQGEIATRLTLLGIVIALHNLLELPRDPLASAIGAPLTGALAFLTLTAALGLLLLALGEHPPQWRWLRSRRVQALVLALTLAAALVGVKQLGAMAIASGAIRQPRADRLSLGERARCGVPVSHSQAGLRGQAELSSDGLPATCAACLGGLSQCDPANAALRAGAGCAAHHFGSSRAQAVGGAALSG